MYKQHRFAEECEVPMAVQGSSYSDTVATQKKRKLIWLRGERGAFCVYILVPTISLF